MKRADLKVGTTYWAERRPNAVYDEEYAYQRHAVTIISTIPKWKKSWADGKPVETYEGSTDASQYVLVRRGDAEQYTVVNLREIKGEYEVIARQRKAATEASKAHQKAQNDLRFKRSVTSQQATERIRAALGGAVVSQPYKSSGITAEDPFTITISPERLEKLLQILEASVLADA